MSARETARPGPITDTAPHAPHPVVGCFVAACQADTRVVAAFLGGSQARGTADAHSDLDLGLITTDGAHDDFLAGREAFARLLGEPLFLEDFGQPETLFLMLADGTEVEVAVGRESEFRQMANGPYRVLLDKQGILAGVTFVERHPGRDEQRETLRRLIVWFWHDLSHFITAFARGHWWWAHGQLEVLRGSCVNLARLRHDFADADVGSECYFKVEQALPAEQLSPLWQTICSLEPEAMLRAAFAIVHLYQALAPPLAETHGLAYPHALERMMLDRLDGIAGWRQRSCRIE